MYTRPVEPTLQWIEERFANKPQVRRRQRGGLQGRARLRRDGRAVRPPLRGASRRRSRRAPTRTSTATPRSAWGLVAAGQLAELPLFLGSYPITPASDILHELSKHKHFGVRTLQAEDEIAGIGAAIGAAFGGHLGGHHHQRAGHGAQGGGAWAWPSASSCRCSSSTSSAAVPPPGCPPRPRRPTCCMAHVRPPRRVAAADRRRPQPGALLLRGDRGGADRAQVPHAGDPAVRRLPGQRLRAVAAARRRGRCPTSPPRSPTEPNHVDADGDRDVLALPARSRHARPRRGPSRARPG